MPGKDAPSPAAPLALLALIAAPLFLARLDAPLLEPQEPRYAEVARQTAAADSPLVPVLHGRPYLDKPPLLYWLVGAAFAACGPHDWAARLVPGLAGVATVLAAYLWGRRALGPRAGLCGALVLALTPRFVYLARFLTFDGLLALWTTAALGLAHAALDGPRLRRGPWALSALACGLGLLTKGPVALALVLPPLAAFRLLGRGPRVGPFAWSAYAAVAVAVAVPWYAAVEAARPGYLADFLWRHHVARFAEPFDHEEPFWFFLPPLLLGLLPWALLLPALARRLAAPPPGLLLPALAAGWGLLFFSASGCKRAVYIVPVLPPLAVALGAPLEAALALRRRWAAAVGVAFVGLLGAVVFLLPAYNARFGLREPLRVLAGGGDGAGLAVVCYPYRFDSVSFYLPAADVAVFAAGEEAELLARLRDRPDAILVVRGKDVEGLRRLLPPTVDLAEAGGWAVVAGRLVPADGGPRTEAAPPRIITP